MLVPFLISVVIQVLLLIQFREGRKKDLVLNTTIVFVLLLNIIFFLHAFFGLIVPSHYVILAFVSISFISLSSYVYSQITKRTINE